MSTAPMALHFTEEAALGDLVDLLSAQPRANPRPRMANATNTDFVDFFQPESNTVLHQPTSSPHCSDPESVGNSMVSGGMEPDSRSAPESEPPEDWSNKSNPKKRKKESIHATATEIRARKNECEKRRIQEIATTVDQLRKEIHDHAPELDCSSKLACLQSALLVLQQQRSRIVQMSGMPAPRMMSGPPSDPYGVFAAPNSNNSESVRDMNFVFRNGSCASAIMSTSGNILDMNNAFQKMCGLSPAPAGGPPHSLIQLTPPEELPIMMQAMSQLLVGDVPKINLNKTCRSPQHDFPVNLDLSVVYDSHGKPVMFVCSAVPIRCQPQHVQQPNFTVQTFS